jgi:hypothetical protein
MVLRPVPGAESNGDNLAGCANVAWENPAGAALRSDVMRPFLTLMATGLVLCGCGDSPEARETRQQIREAAERTGDYLAEQGRALRDQISGELGEMDEDIAELDDRAAEAGAEFRERWRHLSDELSDERAVLRQKLDEWREASG